MTAPIDIECPACKSGTGNYCTSETTTPGIRMCVTFHHAERVDAAARATDRRRRDDPDRLREALRQAIQHWSARDPEMHDAEQRDALREEFDL